MKNSDKEHWLQYLPGRSKTDILLVIDNSERELAGMLMIQDFLLKENLDSKLCSIHNIETAYNWWQPAAILFPRVYDQIIATLANHCFIFILPSESGNNQREQVLATLAGTDFSDSQLRYADLCFCWGTDAQNWLVEEKAADPERLIATGHPATDHWFIKRSSENVAVAGLTTTFRFFNNAAGGFSNLIKALHDMERTGGDGTYYQLPGHAETWVHFEAAYVRLLCNIIDRIVTPMSLPVELRPHPGAKSETYSFWEEITGGALTVKSGGSITEWFDRISVLFTAISASALDAYVQKVPVVSLQPSINQNAFQSIPRMYHYQFYDYFWQLNTIDEFAEYSRAAFEGRLALARDASGLDRFLKNGFNYPRKKSSAELIASAIADYIRRVPARKWKRTAFFPRKRWLLQPLKFYNDMHPDRYMHVLYNYHRKQTDYPIHVTYLPWMQDRILRARNTNHAIMRGLAENIPAEGKAKSFNYN